MFDNYRELSTNTGWNIPIYGIIINRNEEKKVVLNWHILH